MLKRLVLLSLMLCLGLLASVQLASAGGFSGGSSGSFHGASATGLVWGGGQSVAPPTGSIRPTFAPLAYVDWGYYRYYPMVNHYDWSRWLGWIQRPD